MMYVAYSEHGEILHVSNHKMQADHVLAVDTDTLPSVSAYYIDGDALTKKPPQPGLNYIFDYQNKQWVLNSDASGAMAGVRAERKHLLQASDWTQLPDVPLATKEAWAAYRQALRDVTLQPDPFNIVWPTPPA